MNLTDWLLLCFVYVVLDNTIGPYLYGLFYGYGEKIRCSNNQQ